MTAAEGAPLPHPAPEMDLEDKHWELVVTGRPGLRHVPLLLSAVYVLAWLVLMLVCEASARI